tara:strand:+ start:3784 stop:4155 length:372 start_codon:yes stop_codon:yes gene_type:complete
MRLALALTLVLFLGGCLSPLGLLSSFGGGGGSSGTSVNANTQIGKENNQSAFDQSRDISGENVNVNQSQGAFSVDGDAGSVKVLNQDIPMWMILLAVLGWMLPSPIEIWRGFLKTITFGRYRG